jgi:hypothetical protein
MVTTPNSEPRAIAPLWRRHWGTLALAVVILLGILRIAATYPEYTQTIDEVEHVAAGMEWLDRGTFVRGPEHPPLSRIAVALGPYLEGIRSQGKEDFWEEGNAILHANDNYWLNLSLARAGILPFFVLAALVVWHWTRTLFGARPAFLATLLFTTLPTVLAHAGLATTDLPLTATLIAALYAFDRWLAGPNPRRALVLGLTAGLAVATKFSALLFLPVCGAPLLLLRYLAGRRPQGPPHPPLGGALLSFGGSILIGVLTVWALYRFSISDTGVPAPELFEGIAFVLRHNRIGHLSFLLGEVRTTGWWYFFPIALLFKTPLPFLLLAATGLVLLLSRARQGETPLILAPGLVAIAMLLSVLPVDLNIGVRHILPIYPFLAMLGGYAAMALWNAARQRLPKRILVGLLLAGQLTSSIAAHPDYLPYFNVLAGEHPEKILVDSDLDWGQDLDRLARVLKTMGVQEVSICYFGSADLSRHGLPNWRQLPPNHPVTGWVAISTFCYTLGNFIRPYTGYHWLDAYQPVRAVGHSMHLYHIPAADNSPPHTPNP